MNRYIAVGLASCVLCSPVYASLKPGTEAPDFTTQATLAGKPFKFSLSDALKSGPVVLYFYPAAFTKGCTIEAHEFAEATEKLLMTSYSNRTSYVIGPTGRILYAYTALSPDKHVENTLAAVAQWNTEQQRDVK
jgi:peroxiredoxin